MLLVNLVIILIRKKKKNFSDVQTSQKQDGDWTPRCRITVLLLCRVLCARAVSLGCVQQRKPLSERFTLRSQQLLFSAERTFIVGCATAKMALTCSHVIIGCKKIILFCKKYFIFE